MPMEKQNTVENQLAHTITQTEFDSDYDKTAKKLLANKQILAQIMKADSGEIISEVKAPTDGIIFYAETRPVVYSNLLVFQIIKRIHL